MNARSFSSSSLCAKDSRRSASRRVLCCSLQGPVRFAVEFAHVSLRGEPRRLSVDRLVSLSEPGSVDQLIRRHQIPAPILHHILIIDVRDLVTPLFISMQHLIERLAGVCFVGAQIFPSAPPTTLYRIIMLMTSSTLGLCAELRPLCVRREAARPAARAGNWNLSVRNGRRRLKSPATYAPPRCPRGQPTPAARNAPPDAHASSRQRRCSAPGH